MVTYRGLRQSGRALKAFCLFYLPYYQLPIEFFFDNFGLFTYLEASLYDVDSRNEKRRTRTSVPSNLLALTTFLKKEGYWDDSFRSQIDSAQYYFRFERRISTGGAFSLEEAVKVAAQRSFDFRLLHRLLWRIRSRPYDERVFAYFIPFEKLMEFDDDVASATEDYKANTFNIVNCFKAHGAYRLKNYVRALRRGIKSSEVAEGRKYKNLIRSYLAIVPNSVLETDDIGHNV